MLKMIELPYSLNALEPFYSRETLNIHYNTLYANYVENTNKTEEKLKLARKNNDFDNIKCLEKELSFQGSGVILHKIQNLTIFLFFAIIKPTKKEGKIMESKRSIQSLRALIIVSVILLVIGIVIGILNVGQVNEKVAKLTEEEQINIEEKKTLDCDTIVAAYTPRRDVASEEVVSRYARARQRELYNSIDEITISKDMDLTVRCNVSREDFISLMADVRADTSGFFEQNAGTIYDVCEKYQINEIFFCGLISAESGWNIAGNHRRTHNYISLMSGSGLIQFNSVEEGLEKAASALHNNYLTPGGRFYCGKTLESVRTRFCPVNPGWTNLVYGRMQQIV